MKKRTLWFAAALCLLVTVAGCDSSDPASPPPDVVDTTPPVVSITAPVSGEEVVDLVTVVVEASDDVGVERVELWVDGRLEERDYEAPWSFDWNTRAVDNGPRAVRVKAYDAANNEAESGLVPVEVTNVARVTFVNGSLSAVGLRFNGEAVSDSLQAGASRSFQDPEVENLAYEAATRFSVLAWDGTLDLSNGRDRVVHLDVPPEYAFLYLDNAGSLDFHTVLFDYGNFFFPSVSGSFVPGGRYALGYRYLNGLIDVTAVGMEGGHTWVPHEDFVIPGTVNQVIVLEYP